MRPIALWVPTACMTGLALVGCAPSGSTTLREPRDFEALHPPSLDPSRLPHFATAASGEVFLSWVREAESAEGVAGDVALHAARWTGELWNRHSTVASGSNWFVNWADIPALAAIDCDHLMATFLEKSGAQTYDYGVRYCVSNDAGRTWSSPTALHDHAGPGEHGFVSLAPMDATRYAAIWLDGRTAAVHDAAGAMQLRARAIATDGTRGAEVLLDERVCDCCPTSVARAGDGSLLVAYRDRSPEEVRDIALVRWKDGEAPRQTFASDDHWKIAGCPVNGPVVCSEGSSVALAWFTMSSKDVGRVRCALSQDGGLTFARPFTIAEGRTQGRVASVFDKGTLFVAWLEADGSSAEWRIAGIGTDGTRYRELPLAAVSNSRDAGLIALARDGDGVVCAWTEPGSAPHVRVVRLDAARLRPR